MKKVALVASAIVGFIAVQFFLVDSVHAQEKKTIAIIDTAIDSSKFNNIVYEACFTYNKTCQNKEGFQEGKGSALINDFSIRGADHGFNMATIANIINPNINIVFIRISDEKVYDTFSIIRNDGGSLARALAWVSENSARFNISAVSISQSRSNFAVGTCPVDTLFESSVARLKANNVATFVATGNDRKKNQIGFPSCVRGVYSVAGSLPNGTIANDSNISAGTTLISRFCTDFIGTACLKVPDYRGNLVARGGTSVAAIVATSMAVGRIQSQQWDSFITSLPKTNNYLSLL